MYSVAVVIASCRSDLTWAVEIAAAMNVIVYEQCGAGNGTSNGVDAMAPALPWSVKHTKRCGREAHSYLAYIYEHYTTLPERVIFLQGDAPRHLRHFSNFTLALSIESLARSHLTFSMLPGSGTVAASPCQVAWKRTRREPGMQDVQLAIANVSVPISTYTYAHFVVARERVWRHPVDYYRSLDAHFFGETESGSCGRKTASLFERGWPLMFGCSRPVSEYRIIDHPSYGHFVRACRPPVTLFCCEAEQSKTTHLVPGEASALGCA